MASGAQNIQILLEAEKEGAKLVQEAREYRTQKLKDARAEAEKEIEEYRKMKEQEFHAYEQSHDGKKQDSQSAIDRDTEVKLKAITESYESNKQSVVKKLLDRVVLVKPELHRNLKKLET